MEQKKVHEIIAWIRTEATFVNVQEIVAVCKQRCTALSAQRMGTLRVGQRVEFDGRFGRVIQGTIQQRNHTTVSLTNCSDGRRWRVSSYMLRAVPQTNGVAVAA